MSSRRWLLTPIMLELAACATQQSAPPPQLPKVVQVEVDKYVPLDASIIQDCPIEQPKSLSVAEAVRVAAARKLALEKCNADKAAIRAVQPAVRAQP